MYSDQEFLLKFGVFARRPDYVAHYIVEGAGKEPDGVMRQHRGVQHIGITDHQARLGTNGGARLGRRVAVVRGNRDL